MALPLFLLPIFAATSTSAGPVVVTGFAWAPFISPMGEAFRSRSPTDDTLADWFNQADRNHDGLLSLDEMKADASRFFDSLDTDHNGEIEPEELVRYEWQVAPEIQLNTKRRRTRGETIPSRGTGDASAGDDRNALSTQKHRVREPDPESGPEGAARYALLNMPEPVAAADADFNRAVSRSEFERAAVERFQLLDRLHSGNLTLASLRPLLPLPPSKGRQKRLKSTPDTRVGQPLPPENEL